MRQAALPTSIRSSIAIAALLALLALAIAPAGAGAHAAAGAGATRQVAKEAQSEALGKTVLTTNSGHTLYSLSVEKHGKFICADSACLADWHPLTVPAGVKPTGPFTMPGRMPLKRIAEPIEQARAVLFLASPAASAISGVCIPVDGAGLLS